MLALFLPSFKSEIKSLTSAGLLAGELLLCALELLQWWLSLLAVDGCTGDEHLLLPKDSSDASSLPACFSDKDFTPFTKRGFPYLKMSRSRCVFSAVNANC